jgi:hypothetical protein
MLSLLRGFGPVLPPYAFVLTRDRLALVSRKEIPDSGGKGPGTLAVDAAVLPPGSLVESGSRGQLAGPGLSDVVGRLVGKFPKGAMHAASLSVPDDFVRIVVADIEPGGERNAAEVEEVLRWKLARNEGEGAPPLRLTWKVAGTVPAGGTRILGIGVPEEAAASWEAAFWGRGIRIGMLLPEVLAVAPLARAALGGAGLFVWVNGGTVSTAYFEGNDLRFLRSKPEESDPEASIQEIRLFSSYVTEELPPVIAAPDSSPLVVLLQELCQREGREAPVSLLEAASSRGLALRQLDPVLLPAVGLLLGSERTGGLS